MADGMADVVGMTPAILCHSERAPGKSRTCDLSLRRRKVVRWSGRSGPDLSVKPPHCYRFQWLHMADKWLQEWWAAMKWTADSEVRCLECDRWVAGRVPKQGDGMALKPFPHKDETNEWCVGRIYSTADLGRQRDRDPR